MTAQCQWCDARADLGPGVCSVACLSLHLGYLKATARLEGRTPTAIITGGRKYDPTPADRVWLTRRLIHYKVTRVIHGGAWGVDRWAGEVARQLGYAVKVVPIRAHDWDDFGKLAGHIRNAYMLEVAGSNLDVLLAFRGAGGTENMVATTARATDETCIIDHRDFGVMWPRDTVAEGLRPMVVEGDEPSSASELPPVRRAGGSRAGSSPGRCSAPRWRAGSASPG